MDEEAASVADEGDSGQVQTQPRVVGLPGTRVVRTLTSSDEDVKISLTTLKDSATTYLF